jgi:bifunctional ADP-heptose synthase (sugar kinase/adenylyltransferase)
MNPDSPVLTPERAGEILAKLPSLRIGVFGDLFLDRYLDIDAALTEPSIETGLDAYQVVRVRSCPGAAGTVINNLAALGVGTIKPLAVIGDDGEGCELWQALEALPGIQLKHVVRNRFPDFRTPTYTKPMLQDAARPARELNRLDIKKHTPLQEMDGLMLPALQAVWPDLHALIVIDQVSAPNCGVVTEKAREMLADLGQRFPRPFVLADSRARIGAFRNVYLKPNDAECRRQVPHEKSAQDGALELARRCGRAVFRTLGERGILVAEPPAARLVPGIRVQGPIDIVGAGDSTNAAIACAVAAGARLYEAAAFGNVVASITIQQIGVTGTATPQQIRQRVLEI